MKVSKAKFVVFILYFSFPVSIVFSKRRTRGVVDKHVMVWSGGQAVLRMMCAPESVITGWLSSPTFNANLSEDNISAQRCSYMSNTYVASSNGSRVGGGRKGSYFEGT